MHTKLLHSMQECNWTETYNVFKYNEKTTTNPPPSIEPKHTMYLNGVTTSGVTTSGVIEPKHTMYLNIILGFLMSDFLNIEPKHTMYLNDTSNNVCQLCKTLNRNIQCI